MRPNPHFGQAVSPFVGRRSDLDALADHFDSTRIVTVIGPGGIGKSRLAARYAEEHSAEFTRRKGGGVRTVNLSAARNASDFLTATAAAFDVGLEGVGSEDAIAHEIGQAIARCGRVLVVFDDFERVAGSAPILERWLARATSARFLVTSRVVLGLAGEPTQIVAPLPPHDAMEMFLARANNARLIDDDAGARSLAAEIVEAIDRMPLAIELAASRTRVLSLAELRQRLKQPLNVLGGGRDRHASVRSAVLDSVHLLTQSAQRTFALLSTLRDGVTLDAAEAMLKDILPETSAAESILDGLDTLVRSSLLRVITERNGATRNAYFATIREVAEELRERDSAKELALAAHARAFAAASQRMGTNVDADFDNLLLAHATSVALARNGKRDAASNANEAAQISEELDPLLRSRGLSRLRDSLSTDTLEALALTRASNPSAQCKALLSRGRARCELGETATAWKDLDAALALARDNAFPGLAAVAGDASWRAPRRERRDRPCARTIRRGLGLAVHDARRQCSNRTRSGVQNAPRALASSRRVSRRRSAGS